MALQLSLFSWVRSFLGSAPVDLPPPAQLGDGSLTVDRKLQAIWIRVRREYFPERHDLDTYMVTWSRRRQRRVLASCNWHRRRVIVARELRIEGCEQWLEPLLYHEMCHAVLERRVARTRRGHAWHGKEFKSLERRHPTIPALDHWIRSGGWHYTVRRARGIESALRRRRGASGRRGGSSA